MILQNFLLFIKLYCIFLFYKAVSVIQQPLLLFSLLHFSITSISNTIELKLVSYIFLIILLICFEVEKKV